MVCALGPIKLRTPNMVEELEKNVSVTLVRERENLGKVRMHSKRLGSGLVWLQREQP